MTTIDQDHRIKDERIEIITKILVDCCRYSNVYIQTIPDNFGVCFQFRYLGRILISCFTYEELYLNDTTIYYTLGNSIYNELILKPVKTL